MMARRQARLYVRILICHSHDAIRRQIDGRPFNMIGTSMAALPQSISYRQRTSLTTKQPNALFTYG